MSESVLPMFSSRSFIVSGLTFIFIFKVEKCHLNCEKHPELENV